MTTVTHCKDLPEAMSLRIALDAAGIHAFIPDENAALLTPVFFFSDKGVRLQVAEEDLEEAREVIERSRAEGSR